MHAIRAHAIRAIDAAPAMILDKSAAMIIQTGRSAVILHDRLLPAKMAAMKCNVSNCGGVARRSEKESQPGNLSRTDHERESDYR